MGSTVQYIGRYGEYSSVHRYIWEISPRAGIDAIELENFWFALKPINMWIYF